MPKVIGPIGYGLAGSTVPPGTPIDVSEEEAARLIAKRGFTLVSEQPAQPSSKPAGDEEPPEIGDGNVPPAGGNTDGSMPPAPLPSPSALQGMKIAELEAFAAARGVKVPEDATKRQIIEALTAAVGGEQGAEG